MRRIPLLLSIFTLAVSVAAPTPAQLSLPQEKPIRLGRQPALSPDGQRLAFGYQGNLWVAPVTGGPATRITAADCYDSNPKWSPDGKWIAFNSDREGGNQVFLIPSVGGSARQVTFHSAPAVVSDWYPDGKSLLVASSRDTRHQSIYKLDAATGRMKLLLADEQKALHPTVSPDGRWIAWTRGALVDVIRKNYKGSANYDVWIAPADFKGTPKRLTDSDKNDMWPVWGADSQTVYFSSERSGTATVWKQAREGGKPAQVVQNPPDAVRYVAIARDGKTLAYESDNRICVTPAVGGPAKEIPLLCRTDERGARTTYSTLVGQGASEFALSPDGKRTAFIIRGDVWVVTNDRGGEAKRLTNTPIREANVAWAPDGKQIAFSSARNGAVRIYRVDPLTVETKPLTTTEGVHTNPAYSPDGKWIVFRKGPQTSLWAVRADGGGEQELVKGPKIDVFRWSPDGKWIAFEKEDDFRHYDVWLTNVTPEGDGLRAGKPLNITDHPGLNDEPRWTGDGARIIFRTNRYRNRDIETINHRGEFSLYAVSLEKEKEKFEESEDELLAPKPAPAAPANPAEKKAVEVKLDPDEIERRAKALNVPDGSVGELVASPDGKTVAFVAVNGGQPDIWQINADGTGLQRLTTSGEAPNQMTWSPDSNRLYFLSAGRIRFIGRGGGAPGQVNFTARMEIERAEDWKAAFDEAWTIFQDRFYDKTFRGLDWKAVGQKYRGLIDECSTRQEFDYLVTQMLGELNTSHTGFRGAATRPARQTGVLGILPDADYDGPGVKVASLIPRSPAAKAESKLNPGEYVLKVDGAEVKADASLDKALADKVGRTVTLLVNDKPTADGARTVKIKPITRAALNPLLYEQWIDQNKAAVAKASGGRVGYLHVDDMGNEARNRFERELFSVGQRTEAMVLDFRNNNGGDTHDSLLRMLERNRHYFTFAPRTETPFPQPERAWTKPVILLINEASLSDAEVFANGFKELGLGRMVGNATMGWIVFTQGTSLVDGTQFRIPHLGCFTLDGRDMENWGVPPDVRVDLTPADVLAGRDPQIEKAVEEVLKDKRLKK